MVLLPVGGVGTVDPEELSGAHVICVDDRHIRDPIGGQNGLIGCEEFGSELHEHFSIECYGDWPPGPRALELLHFGLPRRGGIEEVVRTAGLVGKAARDQAVLDDGEECGLITCVIHHTGKFIPNWRAFRHRRECWVHSWVINALHVELVIERVHHLDH